MAKSIADKLKAGGIAASRGVITEVDPTGLTIVRDKKSILYEPRIEDALDEAFVRDIMHRGVIEPILCRDNGLDAKERPIIQVIAGHRRTLHLLEANERLEDEGKPRKMIKVLFVHGSDIDMVLTRLAENAHKKTESIASLAWKVKAVMGAGCAIESVQIATGLSAFRIKNVLSFLNFAPEVQKAIESGALPMGAIDKIADVPREEQAQLVKTMKEAGVSKNHEVKDAVTAHRGGKKYEPPERKKAWGRRELKSFTAQLEAQPKNKETIVARAIVDFILGDDKALGEFEHLKAAASGVRKALRKKTAK